MLQIESSTCIAKLCLALPSLLTIVVQRQLKIFIEKQTFSVELAVELPGSQRVESTDIACKSVIL